MKKIKRIKYQHSNECKEQDQDQEIYDLAIKKIEDKKNAYDHNIGIYIQINEICNDVEDERSFQRSKERIKKLKTELCL
jgi:hypothetical protein